MLPVFPVHAEYTYEISAMISNKLEYLKTTLQLPFPEDGMDEPGFTAFFLLQSGTGDRNTVLCLIFSNDPLSISSGMGSRWAL